MSLWSLVYLRLVEWANKAKNWLKIHLSRAQIFQATSCLYLSILKMQFGSNCRPSGRIDPSSRRRKIIQSISNAAEGEGSTFLYLIVSVSSVPTEPRLAEKEVPAMTWMKISSWKKITIWIKPVEDHDLEEAHDQIKTRMDWSSMLSQFIFCLQLYEFSVYA